MEQSHDSSGCEESKEDQCLSTTIDSIVERFHRLLKAALKAYSMDPLPLVLHGIHTAVKEEAQSTAAKMVYGTNLQFPWKFISSATPDSLPADSSYLVLRLKVHMHCLRPNPPRLTQRKSHVVEALQSCT